MLTVEIKDKCAWTISEVGSSGNGVIDCVEKRQYGAYFKHSETAF